MLPANLNLYPELHLDISVPAGWGSDYPTFEIKDSVCAREVLAKYINIKNTIKMGVDLRGVDYFTQTLFLKFLETTTLRVILRIREPAPPTIVSRCPVVIKVPLIEPGASYISRLVGQQKIAKKVLDL